MSAALTSVTALPGVSVIGLAGALAVGLVFTHAGLMKLRRRAVLAGVVADYRLLPDGMIVPVARMLPLVEMAIGIALLVGGQRAAVLPAAALLLAFAAAMAVNIRRGRSHIDCGCGRAQLRQPLRWSLVGRNLALAAIVLPRLLPSPAVTSLEIAAAIVGGVSMFLLTMIFDAICALAASPLSTKRS